MILLRHGQSEFNVAFNATRVDPGIPDPRLTEEGRRQARAAAVALAAAAYLLREKHQEAEAAVQNIQDQLDALDPATRAAVIARLTSDEVKKVRGK